MTATSPKAKVEVKHGFIIFGGRHTYLKLLPGEKDGSEAYVNHWKMTLPTLDALFDIVRKQSPFTMSAGDYTKCGATEEQNKAINDLFNRHLSFKIVESYLLLKKFGKL